MECGVTSSMANRGMTHDRGREPDSSPWHGDGGLEIAPGKKALTDGLRAPDDAARRRTALALARAAIARARDGLAPRRGAEAAPDLALSLETAEREIGEAERLGAEVAALRGELDAARAEAAPRLALAPPAATAPAVAPWALAFSSPLERTAAAGVDGPPAQLPHLDAIQRSFGRHDVNGVGAHVGGAAAAAAGAIGAEAYAVGDQVAFSTEPDLFVAAHEAAHVVQQRAGVQLLGGVGSAGDAFEAHADEVAGAVVRGEPAEKLLSEGPGGGGASRAVQMRPAASGPGKQVDLGPARALLLELRKSLDVLEDGWDQTAAVMVNNFIANLEGVLASLRSRSDGSSTASAVYRMQTQLAEYKAEARPHLDRLAPSHEPSPAAREYSPDVAAVKVADGELATGIRTVDDGYRCEG
jgi:hypothetical protein